MLFIASADFHFYSMYGLWKGELYDPPYFQNERILQVYHKLGLQLNFSHHSIPVLSRLAAEIWSVMEKENLNI